MFHNPWLLILLLLLPWAAWALFAKRRQSAVTYSSVALAGRVKPTLRQRLLWLPSVLTLAAMLCLILGLARPREGRERTITDSEGIAIELVVDRSGSMRALDFRIEGEQVDRLTAIKSVASKFVAGGDGLEGRFADLVGLITFAGYADGITPPTLDHTFLVDQLNNTEIVANRDEDGTAIGDALALAVEKLHGLGDERQRKSLANRRDPANDAASNAAELGSQREQPNSDVEGRIKSKVVILLTDGENTAGELEPIQAAELAETLGIRVYTIGVGTKGRAPIPVRDGFTGRTFIRTMPVNIDEATLRQVAETTGAEYFRATDTESLTKIYEEIDQLEKSKVESQHFVDYRELAVQPIQMGLVRIPPILLAAFVLLAIRILLQQTWLRELSGP